MVLELQHGKYSRKYHFGVTKNGLGLVRAQMCASALPEHAVARPEHAMARLECALKVFDRSIITNITNLLKCSQL